MNDNEKDRIAAATNALRPDWPTKSIRTLLDGPQLTNRSRRDVAVALAWVACDSASKTPARVLEAGPWWAATNTEDSPAIRPPKPSEACADCGRREDDHSQWSEHTYRPLSQASRNRTTEGAALARALIREALAGCCSHGIKRATCKESHDEDDKQEVGA
jgi:hypothetical protein